MYKEGKEDDGDQNHLQVEVGRFRTLPDSVPFCVDDRLPDSWSCGL